MNRTVLILGASEEFVDLVRLARERGIRTVVCDGREDAPAKVEADVSAFIPVTNYDEVAQLCVDQQVDGIITGFSDLLLECATIISSRAGLPFYLSPEQLPFYRDKNVMKEMFDELGIPTSRHKMLCKDFTPADLEGLRFPLVAKPLDKYGSRGLRVIRAEDELRSDFDYICATSDDKRILVEEYNDGHEFNLMSWVHEGKVHVLGIADREKTQLDAHEIPYNSRNIYPSHLQDKVEDMALEILQKVIAHTGQTEGELSMQFFWSEGRPVEVCEVAARFLGYEHELITYAGGVSLEELLIDSLYDKAGLERLLTDFSANLPRSAAVAYFQARPGKVASVDRMEALSAIDGVRDLWLYYHAGDEVAPFRMPYFARCTMVADTRVEVDACTERVYQTACAPDGEGCDLLYHNVLPSPYLETSEV